MGKKTIMKIICLLLAFSLLAGCGKKAEKDKAEPVKGETGSVTAPEEAAPKAEPKGSPEIAVPESKEEEEGETNVEENAGGTIYYVDAFKGSDKNSGTSKDSPWRSISKVNHTTFNPGDRLLFKAGTYYAGTLHPRGEGTKEAPIIIDKYGNGSRPVFDGKGAENAVFLSGQSFWEINNLEVINDAAEEGTRRGIYINAKGPVEHVYVKNCYVHNVRGNNDFSTGKPTGGIVYIGTWGSEGFFNDVLVENNLVNYCDRTGIYFGDGCGDGVSYVNTGFVMRNNSINYPGGDGAIINCTDGGLIEYNVVNTTDNVSIQVSAGIWPWYCKDTVFQFNEGYGCKYSFDYDDGMPWDIDGGNKNCIYQYNYSHDNDGGSIMLCADASCPSDNSVIRYNISQNDGGRVLTLTGPSTNTYFYNNTVYLGEEMHTDVVGANNLEGIHSGLHAYNNIFYNLGSGGFDLVNSKDNEFDNNVYFGNHPANEPDDPHKIVEDPCFVAPGTAGIGRMSVTGYCLTENSPCIDAGLDIKNNGGYDYFGTPLTEGAIDIGAIEYVPVEPEESPNGSLSFKKTASASTSESDTLCPENAFDADPDTRWGSLEGVNDTEWLCVDFGKEETFSKAVITWEAAYALKYSIEVSNDGKEFTKVATVENGEGGVSEITFDPVSARFVRVFCEQKYDSEWGFSIYEFEIFK